MNIAFPALFILLLVLPGFILRYSYARGPWRWASPQSLGSFADELAYSVAYAVGFHVVWMAAAHWIGSGVDLDSAIMLLTGSYGASNRHFSSAVGSVADHPYAVASYFVSMYTAAGAAGLVAHWIVRRWHLDRRTRLLRFSNDWYYVLTGEVLEFAENDPTPVEITDVYLSAVVDLKDASYLYRGFVQDFAFDGTGQLDRVLLTFVHRRKLVDDSGTMPEVEDDDDERYYDIPGDIFVLRYADMRTMNLEYLRLTPAASEAVIPAG